MLVTIVVQHPRDLARAALKELRLELDTMGYVTCLAFFGPPEA